MQPGRRTPFYVTKVSLENFRCFERAEVSFVRDGKPRMRTLIIGDNGAGKTTLLRAIALALAPHEVSAALSQEMGGSLLRNGATSGHVTVEMSADPSLGGSPPFQLIASIQLTSGGVGSTETFSIGSNGERLQTSEQVRSIEWFLCGYGASRGGRFRAEAAGWGAASRLRSLFSEEAALVDAEGVLKNLKYRELSAAQNAQPTFSQVEQIVRKLLRLEKADSIEATPDGVFVKGPWGTAPYRQLGDGYRGTGGWLLDYLGAAAAAGRFNKTGPQGTLLLDEIDEHLHPSWQREISTLTSVALPQTQLIATTHSPLTLVNCAADEVLSVKLQGEKAVVLHEAVPIAGRTADDLLKNPQLFGIGAVTDDQTAQLETEYDRAVQRGAGERELHALRQKLRPTATPVEADVDALVSMAAARLKRAHKPSPKAHKPSPKAQKPSPKAHKPSPKAHKPSPKAHKPSPKAQKRSAKAQKPSPVNEGSARKRR